MKEYGYAHQNQQSMKDALAFVKGVEVEFEDKGDKYDEFLNVMNDFKTLRIDAEGAKARLDELFKEHRHLIMRFNSLTLKGSHFTKHGYETEEEEDMEILDKLEKLESALQLILEILVIKKKEA
ncbi:putative transcription regulator Others family [Medicago truncatula]|uniref:Paired amphipathic helix protein n=1 Tax=Medicago truncatula TaxID=3880 RepID=G7KQP2_MEDTR|nr:paired amphipathic helix protein [Medicago truncatula]RHN47717.1 putative transcription regulator Others family [Medicago truncatula]